MLIDPGRSVARRVMVAAVSSLAVPLVIAAQSPVKTITDSDVLDKIVLYTASLERPAELAVVIKPFDASAADLGTGGKDGKQVRQEEARTMQNEGPRVLSERFVAALAKSGPFKAVQGADAASPTGDLLVVEGKFVRLDPGSRAKRYWGGFGAGKSSVEVAGSVKDASGRLLATFEQRRVGAMGLGGGDSLGKLMSDSRSIGEDIAKFLAMWARGEALDE
jgi:hypothetical protein